MPNLSAVPAVRSDGLLNLLSQYPAVRIVTHDNPDPDAIAAGWGLYTLLAERFGCKVKLVAGGAIVRAENRHLIELLDPPLDMVNDLADDPDWATVLVDCGLGTSNHLATRGRLKPVAIIDHHACQSPPADIAFVDIRPNVAAAATIVADYLREQGIEPGVKLATAMLYAIRTETCAGETEHSPLDQSIVLWLTSRAELSMIAEIENAPLPRKYFSDLVLALQGTVLYDDTALCLLPKASGPETVAEVADLLIRCEGIARVLCGGAVDSDLFVSARTRHNGDDSVGLLQKTLDGFGSCGGHTHRAGGKICGITSQGVLNGDLEQQLRIRWLAACGEERQRPKRLIGLREIVENL